MRRAVFFIFFLSGMTGLIYEVIWAKFLVLFIGNTAYAHSIVIAVFMGGLAAGNVLFGRRIDKKPESALFLYGILELGIGLYAFLYPSFFEWLKSSLFLPLASEQSAPWVTLLKFLLSFFSMFLPTLLMGGTLPVLSKFFIRHLSETKREVARLYFLNSIGGVAGCLLAGFWLIPSFGLRLPVFLTGGLNVILGLAVLFLSLKQAQPLPVKTVAPPEAESFWNYSGDLSWLYLAAALSGAVAMLYEIAWIRLLSMVLGSLTYSFALMHAAFNSGIALGALILERLSPRVMRPLLWFGLLQIGVALAVALSIPFYERLPFYFIKIRHWIDPKSRHFGLFQLAQFGFCFLLMILPTTLSGMALPLITQVASRRLKSLGRSVGSVFSFNTIGTVVGVMASGLFLLPRLGIQRTFELGSLISVGVGGVALFLDREASLRRKILLTALPFAVLVGIIFFGPTLDSRILHSGVYRWQRPERIKSFQDFKKKLLQNREAVFYREGLNASVLVEEVPNTSPGALRKLILKINGKVDATSHGDIKTQLLLGHLPMILHPNPRRVLVIGFGSGMTTGAVLQYPVESVDVVEIEPAVIAAGRFFGASNRHALKDRRLHVHLEDARTYLFLNREKYDVIISEPSNPWIAGIGNLYTEEFYREVRKALNKSGLFAQWFHSYENSNELIQAILRTFFKIFPETTVWNTQYHDQLILGALEPMVPDFKRAEAAMEQTGVRGDLARVNLKGFAALLSTQISTREKIEEYLGVGPLHQDDFPLLEYRQPKAFYRGEQASFLDQLDARKDPEDSSLWFNRLRQEQGLSSQDYRLAHQFHSTPPGSAWLSKWILESWLKDFPLDEEARKAARGQGKKK